MSRQPRVAGTLASLARQLGPLDGAEIPGGCECCEAYQTVTPIQRGIWSITVHHDDDCPFLARVEGRAA